jgi:hypothetical protein
MSLAPAERRALDKIEDSLRHSDPQLARMLRRFTVPITHGGLVILARRPGRLRLMVMLSVAVAMVAVLVFAALHGPAGVTPCSPAASTGLGLPASTAGNCPAAQQQGTP